MSFGKKGKKSDVQTITTSGHGVPEYEHLEPALDPTEPVNNVPVVYFKEMPGVGVLAYSEKWGTVIPNARLSNGMPINV